MSDWVTPEIERQIEKIKEMWRNDPVIQEFNELQKQLARDLAVLHISLGILKEKKGDIRLSKPKLIPEIYKIEKVKNKPIGTNYQLYAEQIKQKLSKRRQFKESLHDVQQNQTDGIHWLDYIEKRK